MKYKIFYFLLYISIFALFSTDGYAKKVSYDRVDVDYLYNKALSDLNDKNYKKATEGFESVKSIVPYSSLARQSLERLVEIREAKGQYDKGLADLEELLIYYSDSNNNEELRYKHCLMHYLELNKHLRDQNTIEKTARTLFVFLEDFPYSDHKDEIKEKLSIVNGRLVYREMEVGYFYEIQRNFLASLKRYLIAYNFSKHNSYRDEILYRIYYCYYMIGLKDEGQKYIDELRTNFSESRFLSLANTLFHAS